LEFSFFQFKAIIGRSPKGKRFRAVEAAAETLSRLFLNMSADRELFSSTKFSVNLGGKTPLEHRPAPACMVMKL
jgi:hypothetical protein